MQQRISPASAITGAITLPGDKSISHRYAMISAIADGESRIHNYSTGADCHSTLGCVRALGIDVEVAGTEVRDHRARVSTDCARPRAIWTRAIRAPPSAC